MTLPVFWAPDCPSFTPDLDQPLAAPGQTSVLAGASAHHAATVMRLGTGERFELVDGEGRRWECEILTRQVGSAGNEIEFRVLSYRYEQAFPVEFNLVQALSKTDRDLQAVEAAIELGAGRIFPWQAHRSIAKWGAKAAKMQAKWENLAVAANKQSRRAHWARVEELLTSKQLAQLIASASARGELFLVLDPDGEVSLREAWQQWLAESGPRLTPAPDRTPARSVFLIVGPEGGISEEEIELFRASGAKSARMGNTILRASSAGPAALAALSFISGSWEEELAYEHH